MDTNFTGVKELVSAAAVKAGRSQDSIKIVGVSKRHPSEKIVSAVLEGLRDVGEDRLKEAQEKIPEVKRLLSNAGFDPSQIKWHMVGHMQSNKATKAAELFDVIQSVESVKVANKLSRTAVDSGKLLEIFIEVNVSNEATKSGIQPDGLIDLVGEIRTLPGLNLNGLMTIGPLTGDRNLIGASFEKLKRLRADTCERFGLPAEGWELSMGMTNDFELAIESGSTMVRIGTAIFGLRPSCSIDYDSLRREAC